MHQSLQIRNLSRVHWALRKTATEAADGSLKSLTALCVAMLKMTSEEALLFLPVFYANLDPHDFPSSDELAAGAFPSSALNRIFVAVEAMRMFRGIHPAALQDLWPRLWACIELLEAAQHHKPDVLGFEKTRVAFFHSIEIFQGTDGGGPFVETAGVWVLVGHVWQALLKRENALSDNVFHKLCRFVLRATITRQQLEELLESAGGPINLASLVVQHINLSLGDLEDSTYVYAAISLLTSTENLVESFSSALLEGGIVPVLTAVVSTAGRSVDAMAGIQRPILLNHTINLLLSILTGSTEALHHGATQSFKAGILQSLMDISRRFPEAAVIEPVKRWLVKFLPATLVDYTLVVETIEALVGLIAGVNSVELVDSDLRPLWQAFISLATERFAVLAGQGHVAKDDQAIRACDNLACTVMRAKSLLRKCANCQSSVYCSRQCQSSDWRAGHRQACPSMRSQHNSEPFTSRQLSYMRALLHNDYRRQRCEVLCRQLGFIQARPGVEFYTVFWYTEGKVDIDICALGEYPEGHDWGVDWGYWAQRKAQSHGRMDLHFMVLSQQRGTGVRIFPKRGKDARLSDALKRLAKIPRPPVGEDLEEFYEPLILALVGYDEGCIH
ncbi:hypothetical protein C8R43DRAFT_1115460 [Mycena crocata]|nr:hypothetical protein C8R43DRAFT_1115460 [Mycena crocata]